ncbi:hypothetical protein ZOSMA_284G00040 [Zostera marina]|uniref:Uncharacterized protein n=1 Tax=Zostera marina TaxID=29655 RepID=A0A0K9PD14_ZOSMR|nr:hypothetical protein ZOSMA_284G00040 [Zostera marina]
MEAAGRFPSEVPIFMYGEDGLETQDMCAVVYIKPPPVCSRCVSFGHIAERCRFADERPAGKSHATFTGEKEELLGKTNQKRAENKAGEERPGGDVVAESGKTIGTVGRNLNDVDHPPNETLTTETHVGERMVIEILTQDVDMQGNQQVENPIIGLGSGGHATGGSETQITVEEGKTEKSRDRGIMEQRGGANSEKESMEEIGRRTELARRNTEKGNPGVYGEVMEKIGEGETGKMGTNCTNNPHKQISDKQQQSDSITKERTKSTQMRCQIEPNQGQIEQWVQPMFQPNQAHLDRLSQAVSG